LEELDEVIEQKHKHKLKSVTPLRFLKLDVKVEENDIRKKIYLDHIQDLKVEIEKAFKLASDLKENMSDLNCSIVEAELTEKVDNLKLIENMKNCIKTKSSATNEFE
jgi:hypothetical protein